MRHQVEPFTHPDTGFNKLPAIYEVNGDEKVYTLFELDLTPKDGRLAHRYQIIVVWRAGQGKCQYIEDMGVSELYPSGPKCVQSAAFDDDYVSEWIHTVDEVKEMAHQLREIDMEAILGPEHEDLVKGYHDGVDNFFREKKALSISGPNLRVERS